MRQFLCKHRQLMLMLLERDFYCVLCRAQQDKVIGTPIDGATLKGGQLSQRLTPEESPVSGRATDKSSTVKRKVSVHTNADADASSAEKLEQQQLTVENLALARLPSASKKKSELEVRSAGESSRNQSESQKKSLVKMRADQKFARFQQRDNEFILKRLEKPISSIGGGPGATYTT